MVSYCCSFGFSKKDSPFKGQNNKKGASIPDLHSEYRTW